MRLLTEQETKILFQKLAKLNKLIKKSSVIGRDHLFSIGTCIGKFTHGGKFHLTITALDYLAQFGLYKVWIKSSNELSFLYGNHVLKQGVKKITQGTPKYQGVVVFSEIDVPLGFGLMSKSVEETRLSKPTDVIVINQGDNGFYLRKESVSTIFG